MLFFHAFLLGALSAISCVIGALIGINYQMDNHTRSQLMAFGAGALLFATTNELFAKSISEFDVSIYMYIFITCMYWYGSIHTHN